MATDCAIVDSDDELTPPEDLVRLTQVLDAKYDPIHKVVVSDLGRKLGIVEDFNVNLETFQVDKLFVRQSVFRAWLGTNLIVDRSQILDITPKQIVVRDATVTVKSLGAKPATEGLP
jgi:sporulation protein YlmC with PRC-barrel domain